VFSVPGKKSQVAFGIEEYNNPQALTKCPLFKKVSEQGFEKNNQE
jgi:hypothetical protein